MCGKRGSRLIYESVCPAVLMSIIGPNLSISFAAHTGYVLTDPIVPLLPLLVLPYDKKMMLNVTRALKATKLYLHDMKNYYQSYSLSLSTIASISKLFPYCNGITGSSNSQLVQWTYETQVSPNKLVFIVSITDSNIFDLQVNSKAVVKFTESYCTEAHEICYNYSRSAPQLFCTTDLSGGWKVIVMEYLDPNLFNKFSPTDETTQILRNIIDNLHEHNYVHGDIRKCNVLMSKTNELVHSNRMRICLFDFDWSGIENIKCYPAFMNHDDIYWPVGASDFAPLKKEHDIDMFERFIVPYHQV